MSPVPNDAPEPYLVLAAWHCDTCDVQGRSPGAEVECWNCGGPVTVTARPVLRTGEPELRIPTQRASH